VSKPIIFGEIEGIEEGYHFNNRKEMMPTSFHRNWGAGIDGMQKKVLLQSFFLGVMKMI
jgi:putative restriction endonuclease